MPESVKGAGVPNSGIIAGRYELGARLGQGGMGTVFRGFDRETGQSVAIKQLRPEAVTYDPAGLERFAREGEALRRLNHPNIVKLLATVDEGDNHFLVMELITGGSLEGLLASAPGLFPVARVLSIALDLSDALARAHRVEIIHRDLKPSNVLIAEDGTPRLTDFGVAYIGSKERISGSQNVVGTLDYLSPESLLGETIDARSDIWSFGVLLFEMLTGLRPFADWYAGATLHAILSAAPPDLETLRPDCPVALADLTYRMLEKDRNQRIPSVRRVGVELENIIEGRPELLARRRSSFGSERAPATAFPLEPISTTTPFIGREVELAQLTQLLTQPEVRLVTIVGPGGMGKSRLAIEAAKSLAGALEALENTLPAADRFGTAVLVELAPLGAPELLVSAVAEAVGFLFSPGAEPRAQLLQHLRGQRLLFILDNFEHVLAGAKLVSEILDAAPAIKVLATSRERLELSRETLFPLSGLNFPDRQTFDQASEFSGVKLFVQTARRTTPDFELTCETMPDAARICGLVSGMPLGIVLAASWTSMLTVREIADEIAAGFDFLDGELRDVPERQRSLRAVFDHSWNLLSPDDRAVFARLSVFRGGFTRGVAQAVAGAQLRTLARLMNKSLILRSPDSGRYEIHELLRQYAQLRLEETPSDSQQTRSRHSAYYANFLHEREARFKGQHPELAALEIEAELDNVRAAWTRIVEQLELADATVAIEALHLFYSLRALLTEAEVAFKALTDALTDPELMRGSERARLAAVALTLRAIYAQEQWRNAEAIELTTKALELLDERLQPRETGRALSNRSAALLWVGKKEEAVLEAERALSLYRTTDDYWGTALALTLVARHYGHLEPEKAEACCLESIALQRSFGERTIVIPASLLELGNLRIEQGAYDEGCRLLREALAIIERQQDFWLKSMCLRQLANAARKLGRYSEAETHARRGLELARGLSPAVQRWSHAQLGDILKEQSRLDEAADYYRAGAEGNNGPTVALTKLNLGDLALLRGDHAEAKRLFSESLSGFEQFQVPWGIAVAHDDLGYLACREGDYPAARSHFQQALEVTLASKLVPLALSVCAGIALLCARSLQPERAVELLSLVRHHPASEHQTRVRRVEPLMAELATVLPEAELAAGIERGRGLELATALREGLRL